MHRALTACLLLVGVIHLLPLVVPLVGVLGAARLAALYGIPVAEPNVEILLRHRAVLFGALGGFLVCAAFRPRLHAAALGAGAISVVSFLLLAYTVDAYNVQIGRVVAVDWVARAALLVAAAAYRRLRSAA